MKQFWAVMVIALLILVILVMILMNLPKSIGFSTNPLESAIKCSYIINVNQINGIDACNDDLIREDIDELEGWYTPGSDFKKTYCSDICDNKQQYIGKNNLIAFDIFLPMKEKIGAEIWSTFAPSITQQKSQKGGDGYPKYYLYFITEPEKLSYGNTDCKNYFEQNAYDIAPESANKYYYYDAAVTGVGYYVCSENDAFLLFPEDSCDGFDVSFGTPYKYNKCELDTGNWTITTDLVDEEDLPDVIITEYVEP